MTTWHGEEEGEERQVRLVRGKNTNGSPLHKRRRLTSH
jgi:hypothetical protein